MTGDLETLSFERALKELEAVVQRLESSDLSLEEAIALYERGVHLARRCGDALDRAELQVQQLESGDNQQQMGVLFEEEAGYSTP